MIQIQIYIHTRSLKISNDKEHSISAETRQGDLWGGGNEITHLSQPENPAS